MNSPIPRIAVTTGEPAGIGPDLVIKAAQQAWRSELVAIGSAETLAERASVLDLPVKLVEYARDRVPAPSQPGKLMVLDVPLREPAHCGILNAANADAVLGTLNRACDGCLDEEFDAMVTAPVHKAVLNSASKRFLGHTEYLAERCDASEPLMLLVADDLRVALVTTHLPLRAVPDAITTESIEVAVRQLGDGLQDCFGLARPRIMVLGLNPHAGEQGHLGDEEGTTIEPALTRLRASGLDLIGPVPADTAFVPAQLEQVDAVLAMYHDQGLTVLKHRGFGTAINITLGLPIVRTSVDHGTALDLAGTGRADAGSLSAAIALAHSICLRHRE